MIPTSSELIDKLGGPAVVARLLGIKPPSVVGWRANGIPDDKLIRLAPTLEKAGIATRRELRPDDWQSIWPELAQSIAATN
ncbi:YdaS family helix-turn-helix protein [Massilia sp. YIM B02769]|uniref:YdaS family helix-turn-helix protein n=1 Tax=Massilia sp. YIM B02769 TaxID=3050129 RepID=UPI0025B6D41B|nr:YdaS family helix-turn-helix protein [Massilia sp. YIM B02769]MDN4061462.1 YdaS family helix-turn-helix protein [Massilia sp. YIM B02769]